MRAFFREPPGFWQPVYRSGGGSLGDPGAGSGFAPGARDRRRERAREQGLGTGWQGLRLLLSSFVQST